METCLTELGRLHQFHSSNDVCFRQPYKSPASAVYTQCVPSTSDTTHKPSQTPTAEHSVNTIYTVDTISSICFFQRWAWQTQYEWWFFILSAIWWQLSGKGYSIKIPIFSSFTLLRGQGRRSILKSLCSVYSTWCRESAWQCGKSLEQTTTIANLKHLSMFL